MHTYSYGVLLYSDGRMPPLVALFADLYQFCTRYVKNKSNNDLCSADVLTIARNTRQVNTSAEHRSLLLVSCPPFSTYGLGVRYICSLAPVGPDGSSEAARSPGLACPELPGRARRPPASPAPPDSTPLAVTLGIKRSPYHIHLAEGRGPGGQLTRHSQPHTD